VTTVPELVKFPFPRPEIPYDTGSELRAMAAQGPVSHVELPDGSTAWVATGYREVRQVLTDTRFSRALAASPDRVQRGIDIVIAGSLFGMDPPEHSRLRKLVAGAFTERRMQAMRPKVARIVDDLVDKMLAGPRPADLASSFSLALPSAVICELLGVPIEDFDKFHGWSETLFGTWERPREELMAAFDAITGYMAGLVADKREHPADDLITVLIAARDERDRLSEEELVRFCFGLLIAGHETTANQLNMSFVTLCHYPEEMAKLRANPELIPDAVEELLRWVQIGGDRTIPPARITKEEVELGGVTIGKGEVVMALMNAANRDPSAFPEPDRLDVSRSPGNHVTFGAGAHHCLGAQLARMELQAGLRGLLTRLPGLRMAVPLSEISFKRHQIIASMLALPVTWDDE
jgi:cytochrome P450